MADDDGAGWLHRREMTDAGPKLCRSENLIPFHEGMRGLLTTGSLVDTASALLGEPAVLYKEKTNQAAGPCRVRAAPGRARRIRLSTAPLVHGPDRRRNGRQRMPRGRGRHAGRS